MAHCDGDYTTNLPLADVTGGKAWVALSYGGEPLAPEHGGPARLPAPPVPATTTVQRFAVWNTPR